MEANHAFVICASSTCHSSDNRQHNTKNRSARDIKPSPRLRVRFRFPYWLIIARKSTDAARRYFSQLIVCCKAILWRRTQVWEQYPSYPLRPLPETSVCYVTGYVSNLNNAVTGLTFWFVLHLDVYIKHKVGNWP